MNYVHVVRIDVQIPGQHVFGFVSHHAVRPNPIDVYDAGEFAEAGTAKFSQHKVRVIFHIHGRTITAKCEVLCDPKHRFFIAIIRKNMSLFFYHEGCAAHDMGASHPETPKRLRAVRDAVQLALPGLESRTPKPANYAALARAHSTRHVDLLFESAPAEGTVALDADTIMMPHSLNAARLAAGALVDATDAVAQRKSPIAFCCVRPPGHHAEREQAMGFCLFNNVAAAALQALEVHGMQRVAILDFDVHHGNGTEDIFRDDPRVLLCSSYQHPFYPYTNTPSVDGQRINVPLAAGTGSDAFRRAIMARWLPALHAFKPELMVVSAGFDAHLDDPLGGLALHDHDFLWLGQTIGAAANALCDGRVVAGLEGGYDLAALGRSAAMFCMGLTGAVAPNCATA